MNYTELRKAYLTEWRVWYEMCYKSNNSAKYYEDISVDDTWQGPQGFINFMDDMGERPTDNHYLSRKDKHSDWTPANTVWVDGKGAAGEGRRGRVYSPEYYFYKEMALKNSICYHAFYNRVRRGWSLVDAATLPSGSTKYKDRLC